MCISQDTLHVWGIRSTVLYMFFQCVFYFCFMQELTARTSYGSRLRKRATVIPPEGGISDVDSSSDDETDTDNDDTSFKARGRSLEVEESLSEDEAELPKNAASSKQGDKYK